DRHLDVAGSLVDSRATFAQRLKALPGIFAFYAWWYPTRYFGFNIWPKYASHGKLAKYLRYAERQTGRLSRAIFHGMMVHQAKLQRRQAFLSRIVNVGMELFAMTCAIKQVERLRKAGH